MSTPTRKLMCFCCGSTDVVKVSGIVSAGTGVAVTKSQTSARAGLYGASARTNSTVQTTSQLAAMLAFKPPAIEYPPLFSSAAVKAEFRLRNAQRLRRSLELWNALCYCPKCDKVSSFAESGYNSPADMVAMYRLPKLDGIASPNGKRTIYCCSECAAKLPPGVRACPNCKAVFGQKTPSYACTKCGTGFDDRLPVCPGCGVNLE